MNAHCSTALLESALAGNLPADDETALHAHLDACDGCTAALENLAGGEAWRREAASLLATDDFTEEFDAAAPARDEWSEIDFTVEHLEPADEPGLLGRLGGYDILEVVGHGGMGVVLKGFDPELKRTVAIKVLAPHLARNSLARKRFAREAQAAAAVVHPHVLAIHQVQAGGRLPFLVMPLVAGESLAERLARQGTLELKEILRIGMQAAAGLAAAHEQGLVHRDVKPANILLEKGVERAVLTDFGLARAADDVTLTRWGVVAGTPQYMSPEQARGESLDGRSDLFSLGCVLYEMATGVSPFRTDSPLATMRRLVDDSPQAMDALNPELPPWFVAIVERLLEKDPSRRFQSAAEVSELLEDCLAHVQRPAAVPLPENCPVHQPDRASAEKPWASARRLISSGGPRKLLAGVAIALPLLVAGVVIVLETNKGTLTIESEADDVGVRVTQGDEVVEKLTVTRGKNDVRIAAGQYVVEIDGQHDAIEVKDGNVTINRGEKEIVKIVQSAAAKTVATERLKMTVNTTHVLMLDEPIPRAQANHPDVVELTALSPNKVQVLAKKPGTTQIILWQKNNKAHTIDVLVSPALSAPALRDAFRNAERIAKEVAARIEELKSRFPHLEKFSASEHLRNNTFYEDLAPGTPRYPELYSITYQNDVVAAESPPKSGPRRSVQYKYDPRTGIQLNVHFFIGNSRGADPTPPYRIGDLSVHVYVQGPAGDAIRDEIIGFLKALGAEQGTLGVATEAPSAPPYPAHPPTNSPTGEPRRDSPDPLAPTVPERRPSNTDRPADAAGFSETKEVVLSMNSSKFMLDLDTGQTMDPPARIRPEQAKMDVSTTQVQPYHYPTGLIGHALQGVEVKPSDWNASVADVRRDLSGNVYLLKAMDVGPEKTPTYFFRTRDGAQGILQLLSVTDEPKGIRFRYKTVIAVGAKEAKTTSATANELPMSSPLELRLAYKEPAEELIASNVPGREETIYIAKEPLAASADVVRAEAIKDANGRPAVLITFTDEAATRLGRATEQHRDKPLAILVNGRVLTAPIIHERIGNQAMISGNYDLVAARRLADMLAPKSRRLKDFQTAEGVQRIALSPDGKLLAIANGNPTFILQTTGTSRLKDDWKPAVEILDAETGASVAALKLSTAEEDAVLAANESVFHFEVTALAFLPVEEVVAIGTSIGQVKFFNARTGELIRLLDDEKPRLADKETPENWKGLKRAMGRVGSLAFSPDGSVLAVSGSSFSDFSAVFDRIERGGLGRSVSGPGRLKIWNVKTGTLKHDLAGHSQAFEIAFSSDGSILASAGRWEDAQGHGNGVLVWNPETGEKMRGIQIEANGGTHHVAFSPNKKLIAAGSVRFDKENDTSATAITVAYPLSGITEWQQTMPGWGKPVFSSDGNTLAVLCGGQSIRLVNVETGQLKHEIKLANSPQAGRWNDLTMVPGAARLLVGGADKTRRGIIEIWEMDGHSTHEPSPTDEEVKLFQGEWVVVGLEGDGHKAGEAELIGQKWSVDGNTITGFAQSSTGKMRFTLNAQKSPKEIDLIALDGNQKGTTSYGIYEFQEGRLRICYRGPTATESDRPKEFTSAADSGCGIMVFERKPQH